MKDEFSSQNSKLRKQKKVGLHQDDLLEDYVPYDYSKVEDIAGVDYKKATIITGIFIFLHLFAKPLFSYFSTSWILLTTSLSVAIWVYFKQYFDSMNDLTTGNWLKIVIGGTIFYGIINLFASVYVSLNGLTSEDFNAVENIATLVFKFSLLPIIIIFIAGIKIINVNFRHPFPLKRIAVSAMFIIPIYMLVNIAENTPLLGQMEIGMNILMLFLGYLFGSEQSYMEFEVGFWGNLFLMIPYFFLLHHFYRADMDDATP